MLVGKSLHITWEELACKDAAKTAYPPRFVCDGRIIELIVMFERIRQHFGSKPLIINSAYRTLIYNKQIGGAPNSQHLDGRALDIQSPKGLDIAIFHGELLRNASWMGIKGLGKYNTFCHIDIRPSETLVTWDLSTGVQ